MTESKRPEEPTRDSEARAATEELLQNDDSGGAAGAGNARAHSRGAEDGGTDQTATSQRSGEQLELEVHEAKNAALRAQAELENFRKRMRREMDEERRYASLPLLRDLLAVLDNMHRAIAAAEDSQSTAGLLEGVNMVSDQFLGVLEQHHCRPIQAVGTPFDPNRHEAIGQEPSDEFEANIVCRETRVGYLLHDRVIRPSQVFVSTGPPAGEAGDES